MDYVKGILSGLVAVILAELVPGVWWVLTTRTKATGLAAVAGASVESLFSFRFWILAILFFAVFFAASKLGSKPLRVALFWIPALTVVSASVAIVALFTYLFLRFRHS
ncbi:membrane hypothetical protein [Candidatus Sulfotelmatobacter kueseliae]|uniref:Uncharacterized protein n=1 Tax=Candidatus Sulfotelmatobacter kueseliae TaxID=2042962 RepID=A0A2U3KE74_9BACT|nr:membrane hypothetical protein [Candidatus Sulfotelmatobacter kueseliae]